MRMLTDDVSTPCSSCHLTDADRAECLGLQTQILYYMVRLNRHIGNQAQEDVLAARLDQIERLWTRSDTSQDEAYLEQMREVLDVVVSVAGYVASGEAASARLSAS